MSNAYERVAVLGSLDRFNEDITNDLATLIDKILTKDSIEPDEEKREELADLLLWHADFHAQDATVSDKLMRNHMKRMNDEFQKQTEKKREKKLGPQYARGQKTPYDMLIKVFTLRKDKKLAQQRRSTAKE